jgi:hypothetical protein
MSTNKKNGQESVAVKSPAKSPGMFGDIRDSDFPSELIKANASFKAAMANCVFRDENQRNVCVLYHAQLELFEMTDEINDMVDFMNGSVSIGGYSRVLAVSAHTGLVNPSTLGVKLSKEGEAAWAAAAMNNKARRDNQINDGDKRED